jgi:virginiamycin B lyase
MNGLNAVRHPVSSLSIKAKIDIPGFPDWVGMDEALGVIWISNRDRNNIARVDPATNRVTVEVPVGRGPCSGLAVRHGSVWVPCCPDGEVVRVDSTTLQVIARIAVPIANNEGGISSDELSVWLPTDAGANLAKIDPVTNLVVARIQIPAGSFTAAAGLGAVWVSSSGSGMVSRVDPTNNQVSASIVVGREPRFLAVGFGSIWVLNQGDGTVSRIDPTINQVVATIDLEIPGPGGDIATGAGAVWVTNLGKPLSRIDPVTNQVTAQFIGPGGDALRVGLGAIWLCSFQLQQLWRIDPSAI